jgi:hypothetical protein
MDIAATMQQTGGGLLVKPRALKLTDDTITPGIGA